MKPTASYFRASEPVSRTYLTAMRGLAVAFRAALGLVSPGGCGGGVTRPNLASLRDSFRDIHDSCRGSFRDIHRDSSRDSFRDIHRNPIENPGFTRWAARPTIPDHNPTDPTRQTRIDFLWYGSRSTGSRAVDEAAAPEVAVSVARLLLAGGYALLAESAPSAVH